MAADSHVEAVRALLDTALSCVISVGYPTDPATGLPYVLPSRPYVVLAHDDGLFADRNLEARSATRTYDLTTTAVADSDVGAQVVNALVIAALLDVTPTVSGRSCWPIEHAATDQTRPDTDTEPPVFVGVNRWTLRSTAA